MSSATLTSLAMLKVAVDKGGDYLDYLRPFVLQVLVDDRPDPIRDDAVRESIKRQYGLDIPPRAVQIVLKRLSKTHAIKREMGTFHITGGLPDPGISVRRAAAQRHIRAVVDALLEFTKNTPKPIQSFDEGVDAICAFLSEFVVDCLRAYVQGTAIPKISGKKNSDIILVSEFVIHLQDSAPERFDSFNILVQGHMVANALLCPDLNDAPNNYKRLTFYFDTPLLVRLLGLEGDAERRAVAELAKLIQRLKGRIAAFSHSREELERVLKGAAAHIEALDGRGAIVMEARRRGTTQSDLLLLAGRLDDELASCGISIMPTPRYIEEFQIDERVFDKVLEDELFYYNPRAKEYDINSVRSIYVLRSGTSPTTVEKCKAILVSSNAAFARAAFRYGQQHEESREVSSVIADFSLANVSWLKAPLGAPFLPTAEVLAFSYAALQPSTALMSQYLREIDKLLKNGRVSANDHQLLRSNVLAHDELVRLTLGDDEALSEELITETLRRVSDEIKKEEADKLDKEKTEHKKTRERLGRERSEKMLFRQRLYWRLRRRAKVFSWIIAGVLGVMLVIGVVAGAGLVSTNPVVGWGLAALSGLATLAGVVDLILDFSVRQMRVRLEEWLLARAIQRELAAGIDLTEVS